MITSIVTKDDSMVYQKMTQWFIKRFLNGLPGFHL